MLFALGFIAGIALATFVAVVLLLIRKPLYEVAVPAIKKIELAGIRERGFLVEPREEIDVLREQRIKENAEQGKDTPITELM